MASSVLERYRKYARIREDTEYGKQFSSSTRSRAVNYMYNIVEKAEKQGPSSIAELALLLDEPIPAIWLSHQLLERASVTPEIEKKCLNIIFKRAMEDCIGEIWWLRDWYEKNNKNL